MRTPVSLLGPIGLAAAILLAQDISTPPTQEETIPQETPEEDAPPQEEVIPMEEGPIPKILALRPPPGLLPLQEVAELQPTAYVHPPVLFHEGVLVVVGRGGAVEGFDERTGEFLWKLGLPDKELLSPCATTYGLLLSTRDGTLIEVETSTGEISEEVSLPVPLALTPLITEESYLLASPEGKIVALDLWTKQQLWSAETEEAPAALAVGGDLVVVSGAGGTLTALDAETGQLHWRHRGRGAFLAPAVFDANAERLYIGDDAGDFYSLSSDNGKIHYRWEYGAAVVHPVLVEGDRLYVVSYGNTLIAYRTPNGHELWRSNIPGRPASQPVRVNQRIVVATLDGFIVEVDPSRGGRIGAPYKARDSLRGEASFDPPYAALPLITGDILLLKTAPPAPPPLRDTEKDAESKEERPPGKGSPKKGPAAK